MKISYQREFKYNYLIIDPEELPWQGYESQMLWKNQIEGILRFQVRQKDDGVRFYYEITSRQPIARILENRSIRAEEIRRLVIGIFGVLERMELYLLGEGSILMEPEYLYVDSDSFRIWLCLVPGMKRNFPEDFSRFLEYLLGSVDHQDKESVVLAYGLYQETRKENYGLDDIKRLLQQEKGSGILQQEDRENEQADKRTESENHGERYGTGREFRKPVQEKESKQNESKRKTLWGRWKERIFHKPGKTEIRTVRPPKEMIFQEESIQSCFPPMGGRGAETRQGILEPDKTVFGSMEYLMPAGPGTVLLADFSSDTGQRMLRSLDPGGEDIPLSYYPFIIGKQENLVDFKLEKETVSRLHLRIDQAGDTYRIKDLNSTNGTFLRGRLLDNNEEAELHTGDEVGIARYRYRFE